MLIEVDPANPSPAPAPAAQQPVFTAPPVGTPVTIVSAVANREFDADGKVVGSDGNGIAVRLPDAGLARFYPWQNVAYIQWVPPAEVMEQAAALGGDFAVTEVDQAAIMAVLAKIPGIEYPSEAIEKIRAWDGYIIEGDPMGNFASEDFVRELAKAGIPVKRYVSRPADKRPIIVGEAQWGGGAEAGFGVTGMDDVGADFGAGPLDAADYHEPGEPPPDAVGEMTLRPERHAYRLPPSLASCFPDHEVAIWAAASHSPEELEAIHKVTDTHDFGEYMRRIRDHVPGPMPGTPAREAWEREFGNVQPALGHVPSDEAVVEFPDTPEPHAPGTCGIFAPATFVPEMGNVRCKLPIHTGDHQAAGGRDGLTPLFFHWRETGAMAGFPSEGPSDNWRPQPAPPCGIRVPLGVTEHYPTLFNASCRLPRHADGGHEVVDDEGRLHHWFDDGANPVSGQFLDGPVPGLPLPVLAAPPTPEPPPAPPTDDPQELPPGPDEQFPDPGLDGGPTDEALVDELARMEKAFEERVGAPPFEGRAGTPFREAVVKAEELLAQHEAAQPAPTTEKPEPEIDDGTEDTWALPGQE